MKLLASVVYVIIFLHSLAALVIGANGQRPPSKPSFDYASSSGTSATVGSCADATRVWIFKPDSTTSSSPNVVIYLHGFSISTPGSYKSHIDHLVRQGNVVMFPQFQESICGLFDGFFVSLIRYLFTRSSPAAWFQTAVESVGQALSTLDGDYNNIYLFGHSLGGALGMMWGDSDFQQPVTAAVLANPQPAGFSAIPGFVTTLFWFRFGDDIDVMASAPSTTFPVTVLHGVDDTIAPLEDVMPSYNQLGSSQKQIFQAQTDRHGRPALVANHVVPLTLLGSQDNLDWRYIWSGLDQVITNGGPTGLAFAMGEWDDGTPVASVVQLDP